MELTHLVPMVGGPFDGETRPFSSQSNMCITVVGPLGVRHEWYVLQTHGRLRDGQLEYKDRWVYIGIVRCRKMLLSRTTNYLENPYI